jgi:multiple antibiotic resistance protein
LCDDAAMERELLDYTNAVLFTMAALLPVVNPLGSAPIFLALTADLPVDVRHRAAAVVGRHAFLLLTAAMLIGTYVLRIFGVSLPIVRVGGGLLVTATGWRLLHDPAPAAPETRPADTWEREAARRAFYPLTFPLTVGPGSISIAITLGARSQGRSGWGSTEIVADLVGVALVAISVFLSYRFASRLIAYLGETGTAVFLRLSSFILLCVGVSIVWSGVVDLVQPLIESARR